MILRKSIFSFLLMSLFVLPNTLFAETVIFDFVGFAAGAEHGAVSKVFSVGGLDVTATAYQLTNPSNTYFMYLDDKSGGLDAGLGVCQNLTSGQQCNPSKE